MIYQSILDVVGNTPVVHLTRFSRDTNLKVYLKLESLNPGGSHKARIALGMIYDAEKNGILQRGSGQTILEPSGGNTGMGLAMAANLLGYKLVLVIPDNYSREKQKLLKLFDADIVLSDSSRGNNSHGEKAMELLLEHPNYVMLNQQRNPANPQTHRDYTSQEILDDFQDQPIDFFVGGIGTGGHLTGVGEVLKEHWPNMKVYGVEPEGCDLLNDKHAPHEIQGLSVGLIPDVLNVNIIDGMVRVNKHECVAMAKKIAQTESLSLGISSAANLIAITKLGTSNIPVGSRVLALVYDSIDSYLNYFDE